jgi:hypothetical protein
MFNNIFRKPCCLWDSAEKYCRAGQATDDNMAIRIACWIPKATNTLWDYVILIAFPLQQWLHERASMLNYTYIACIVLKLSSVLPAGLHFFVSRKILILLSEFRTKTVWTFNIYIPRVLHASSVSFRSEPFLKHPHSVSFLRVTDRILQSQTTTDLQTIRTTTQTINLSTKRI